MRSKIKTIEIDSFHQRVLAVVKKIPRGKVAFYGQVAAMAGSPRGARQVVRTLHSSSKKEKLPWHRVINKQGKIALKPNQGYEVQKAMLEKEGIRFNLYDKIDLNRFGWRP